MHQAVHVAAQYGQTAFLNHIVAKHGADFDAPDNDGRSPLHWYIFFKKIDKRSFESLKLIRYSSYFETILIFYLWSLKLSFHEFFLCVILQYSVFFFSIVVKVYSLVFFPESSCSFTNHSFLLVCSVLWHPISIELWSIDFHMNYFFFNDMFRAAYKGFADTVRLLLFWNACQGRQDKEGTLWMDFDCLFSISHWVIIYIYFMLQFATCSNVTVIEVFLVEYLRPVWK